MKRVQWKRGMGWGIASVGGEYFHYVGRMSVYENPFRVMPGMPPRLAVKLFRVWARSSTDAEAVRLRDSIHKLKGRNVGCWCHKNAEWCHGDVLMEMANET